MCAWDLDASPRPCSLWVSASAPTSTSIVNVNILVFLPSSLPLPPRLGPCHHSWPPEPPASTFKLVAAFALKPSVSGPFTSPVSVSSAPFEHQYFIFLILSLIYIPLFSPRSVAIASHDIYNMHTATRHLIYLFIIHNKPSLSSVLSFHRQKKCTLIHAHTRRDIYISKIYKYMYSRGGVSASFPTP